MAFNKNSGFTLIELLVSISIFVVITSVILSNYSLYSRQTDLTRTAQEIALALRKAQSYSLAVRGFGTGLTLTFSAWGLHFENPLASPPPSPQWVNAAKQFVFYSDTSGDKKYGGSNDLSDPAKCSAVPNECSELLQINTSAKIVKLCSGLKTSNPTCSNPPKYIDITYQRPNPSITICNDLNCLSSVTDYEICLTSSDGNYKRTIYVWNTGQIAIDDIACP